MISRVSSLALITVFFCSMATLSAADSLPEKRVYSGIGYLNVTTLGFLMGDNQESIAIHMINGLHYGKYVGMGIGFGLESFTGVTAIPVFADIRVNILPSKTSPYVLAQFGNTVGWGEHDSSPDGVGVMACFGGGIRFEGNGAFGFVIEGGYRLQSKNSTSRFTGAGSIPSWDMVSFSAGFTF